MRCSKWPSCWSLHSSALLLVRATIFITLGSSTVYYMLGSIDPLAFDNSIMVFSGPQNLPVCLFDDCCKTNHFSQDHIQLLDKLLWISANNCRQQVWTLCWPNRTLLSANFARWLHNLFSQEVHPQHLFKQIFTLCISCAVIVIFLCCLLLKYAHTSVILEMISSWMPFGSIWCSATLRI